MASTLLQSSASGNTVRPLDFQQTVPRCLVHRAAVSEVFVTDLNILGGGRFDVGAQWPRQHAFFGPRTPTSHDPMLYAETCRQAGLLIAHRAYGVPLGDGFLSDRRISSVGEAGLTTTGRPVDIELRVTADHVRYRSTGVAGMHLNVECFRDGHRIGTASERFRCVSSAAFRRVRGNHFAATPFQSTRLPTVAPALVGRERAGDVLVGGTGTAGVWSLQLHPEHAVLFDHPVDHVPGMALIEGARQAALLSVGDPYALPVHTEFEFVKYVEFDAECLLVAVEEDAAVAGTRVVRVTLQQNAAVVARGTLTMRLS